MKERHPITSDAERALLFDLLGPGPTNPGDGSADWQRVLSVAGTTLHPLLALRIEERGLDVPETIRARLTTARRANASVVAHRRSAMRQVVAALDAAGVEFTVLKGLALAQLVYPSPETRVMSDVDLWIGSGEMGAAAAILEPLGWRQPWWRQTHARFSADGDELALRLGDTALMIELHRSPLSVEQVIPTALDDFWSRRKLADLGGFEAHVLPWEETLIHLSLHLAEHHQFVAPLPRLVDVSLVISAAGITLDWPAFVERCRTLGIAGWVGTTLGTARALLNAPVPLDALDAFQVPGLDRLCALAAGQITSIDWRALPAETMGVSGWARTVRWRVRSLVMGEPGPGNTRLRAAARLFRRLRHQFQNILPGLMRVAWRNRLSTSTTEKRRLAADNRDLVKAMREWSPGVRSEASTDAIAVGPQAR